MFRITYFFWRAVFLEQLLFQKTLPSVTATFFRGATFLQYTLSEELVTVTVTVSFHVALLIYSLVIKLTQYQLSGV